MSSAPGAFGYCEPVFVHIAESAVGVWSFGYLAEMTSGVPFGDLPHRTGSVVGCRLMV